MTSISISASGDLQESLNRLWAVIITRLCIMKSLTLGAWSLELNWSCKCVIQVLIKCIRKMFLSVWATTWSDGLGESTHPCWNSKYYFNNSHLSQDLQRLALQLVLVSQVSVNRFGFGFVPCSTTLWPDVVSWWFLLKWTVIWFNDSVIQWFEPSLLLCKIQEYSHVN